MTEQTIIFIGQSGCGKGTQAELLQEYIQKHLKDSKNVLHIGTGERFREFIQGTSYTSKRAMELYKVGIRMPDFLAIWNWSHIFVDSLNGEEHIILDGAPRSLNEAENLDSAFKFYKREKPIILHIKVSDDWARERLLSRKRTDDRAAEIETRLAWFTEKVMPAVEYYRTHPDYSFFEINGEQSIEEVRADIEVAIKSHFE